MVPFKVLSERSTTGNEILCYVKIGISYGRKKIQATHTKQDGGILYFLRVLFKISHRHPHSLYGSVPPKYISFKF